jgi:hypothetical protein
MEAKKPAPNAEKPDYRRTEKEEGAIVKARARFDAAPPMPHIKVSKAKRGHKSQWITLI